MTIYTIGHGTLAIRDFIDILRHYKIKCLVDVRRWPGSTHNPQYNRSALEKSLASEKIKYFWFGEALGGYRKLTEQEFAAHSPGKCLRVGGFRQYAAHMQTDEFKKGLNDLLGVAEGCRTAIMCAEKVYFKCHRMLISDKLKLDKIKVVHIFDKERAQEHEYSSCAKVKGKRLYY